MTVTVERPKTLPLESPMFRILASIGSADLDEIRYQAEKLEVDFDEAELDRLEEEGHAVEVGGTWSIVVPEKIDRGNMRGPAFEPDDILDRIKLWALIFGRPPADVQWGSKRKLEKLVDGLRRRLSAHLEAQQLYDEGDWPSANTVAKHFGSLNAGLVAAGFDARPTGNLPQDEKDAEQRQSRALAARHPSLDDAYETLAQERGVAEPDQDRLHTAFVGVAMAAFNEAERIRPWDPGGDE